jgi:hypothetical protein
MRLSISLLACIFFLGVVTPVPAWDGGIDLRVEGEILSARIEGVPFKIVLENLERQRGIWFMGDPSLLEEEVTVEFIELPLEQGLKRILSSVNHVLLFDGNGGVLGVIVIGRATAGPALSEGRVGIRERAISPPSTNRQADIEGSFTVIRNLAPPGGVIEVSAEEIQNFEVIRNVPSPGGPVKVSAEELENFKVIRNCPPPGS